MAAIGGSDAGGILYVSATPGPQVRTEQWIIFYADMETGWPLVYGSGQSCEWKVSRLTATAFDLIACMYGWMDSIVCLLVCLSVV